MDLHQDIFLIDQQEQCLQFEYFDKATAWELGCTLKSMCEKKNSAIAIEIRLCHETVFFCSMPGASPNNADWVRRKRNTTELLQQCSYAAGRVLARDAQTQQSLSGLPLRDYSSYGGSFPIRIVGVGFVGAVTVSGLPERDDHNLIVQALATMLEKSLDHLVLL
jgi:uncharacterized protein (UPF0303 family)